MNAPASPPDANASWSDVARVLRPRQWTKNLVVLAAFFFALGDKQQTVSWALFWQALAAAGLFCLASSGIYVFNDLLDVARDRLHPVKCRRPIAAGRLGRTPAWGLSLLCLGAALGGALMLESGFAGVVATYVGLQVAYTLKLKHVPLVDVFVIAIGFVLRAIAGGFAVQVALSAWLLICTFLMALFLALCKRRHERRLMEEQPAAVTRPSLQTSDVRLLDQLIAIVAGAVIVTYALYTLWPETVQKFNTHRLSLTLPFVVFGLFRYLDLVYREDKGDQPESILLTDPPLIVDIALFGAVVLWVTCR